MPINPSELNIIEPMFVYEPTELENSNNTIQRLIDSITQKDGNLRVTNFGYELEGGFDEIPRKYFHSDGSVECNDYEEPDDGELNGYSDGDDWIEPCESITGSGECVSPVFSLDKIDKNIGYNKTFRDFAKKHHAQEINSTCGHHIHVSFSSELAYSRLMDSDFFNEFEKEVLKFVISTPELYNDKTYYSRFIERYDGDNSYCYKRHSPQSQVNGHWHFLDGSDAGRYTHLNYPYGNHGTIECRLFPAPEKSEQLVIVTEWFVNFTNSYLHTLRKERAKKHNVKVIENEEITSIEVQI